MENIGKEMKRDVAAVKILNLIAAVDDLSAKTSFRAEEKLGPILMPQTPLPTGGDEAKEAKEELPPLFSQLRGSLESIKRQLLAINNTLDRAEV